MPYVELLTRVIFLYLGFCQTMLESVISTYAFVSICYESEMCHIARLDKCPDLARTVAL